MPKLTSEQIDFVKRLLDERGELPPELRWVLFPPEKQECELVYAGKRREEDILADTMSVPLQPMRSFNNQNSATWHNRLIFGDNLQALKSLSEDPDVAGKVKLVYIDPPFATRREFRGSQDQKAYQDKVEGAAFVEFIRKRLVLLKELLHPQGSIYVHLDQKKSHYIKIILDELFGDGNFQNEIIWRNTNSHSKATTYGKTHQTIFFYSRTARPYFKKWKRPPFKKYIESNFSKADDGQFYARADVTASERRTGDSGKPWNGYDPTAQGRHWSIPSFIYDLIDDDISSLKLLEKLDYLNKNGWVHMPDKEGGQPRIYKPLSEDVGNFIMDVWSYQPYTQGIYEGSREGIDEDVSWSVGNQEVTDYPTQKPEGLLARIIKSSTKEGDIVLDAFAGSGTTCAVAEKMGRRWIGIDCGKLSIYTIQKRMLNLRDGIGNKGNRIKAQPFTLYHAGLYDFASLRELEWEKWRFFALRLFECKDRRHMIGSLPVDGERRGAPVLVFNWKEHPDEYISEETIDDIHAAIGDKIGRKFYIIAPMLAFDFAQDYIDRDGVRYYALKIPYQFIKELHNYRDFQAVLQVRDAKEVNDIQEAYGFSFIVPPDVEFEVGIEAQRTDLFTYATITTKEFTSHARVKGTERDAGKESLAMLLVDLNYDGEVFNMSQAFFAQQLGEQNWIARLDPRLIGQKVMAVWIDNHGNEFTAVIPREDFGLKSITQEQTTNGVEKRRKRRASIGSREEEVG